MVPCVQFYIQGVIWTNSNKLSQAAIHGQSWPKKGNLNDSLTVIQEKTHLLVKDDKNDNIL